MFAYFPCNIFLWLQTSALLLLFKKLLLSLLPPLHICYKVPHLPRRDALLVHLVHLGGVARTRLRGEHPYQHAQDHSSASKQPGRVVPHVSALYIDCQNSQFLLRPYRGQC